MTQDEVVKLFKGFVEKKRIKPTDFGVDLHVVLKHPKHELVVNLRFRTKRTQQVHVIVNVHDVLANGSRLPISTRHVVLRRGAKAKLQGIRKKIRSHIERKRLSLHKLTKGHFGRFPFKMRGLYSCSATVRPGAVIRAAWMLDKGPKWSKDGSYFVWKFAVFHKTKNGGWSKMTNWSRDLRVIRALSTKSTVELLPKPNVFSDRETVSAHDHGVAVYSTISYIKVVDMVTIDDEGFIRTEVAGSGEAWFLLNCGTHTRKSFLLLYNGTNWLSVSNGRHLGDTDLFDKSRKIIRSPRPRDGVDLNNLGELDKRAMDVAVKQFLEKQKWEL